MGLAAIVVAAAALLAAAWQVQHAVGYCNRHAVHVAALETS